MTSRGSLLLCYVTYWTCTTTTANMFYMHTSFFREAPSVYLQTSRTKVTTCDFVRAIAANFSNKAPKHPKKKQKKKGWLSENGYRVQRVTHPTSARAKCWQINLAAATSVLIILILTTTPTSGVFTSICSRRHGHLWEHSQNRNKKATRNPKPNRKRRIKPSLWQSALVL